MININLDGGDFPEGKGIQLEWASEGGHQNEKKGWGERVLGGEGFRTDSSGWGGIRKGSGRPCASKPWVVDGGKFFRGKARGGCLESAVSKTSETQQFRKR